MPNWDIPLRKGFHEGLITLETFLRIQDRLRGGARVPSRKDLNRDFALRGFIVCADCGHPLTACWSKSKTGAKHPYYFCHHAGCPSVRKSIRRDKLEGDFEALLRQLQPSRTLVDLVRKMFAKAWDTRLAQAAAARTALNQEIIALDRQIQQLVDRVVSSPSPTAISAYEERIARLERDKLVAAEKLAAGPGPRRSFDEMFELAMAFLANPWKLWASERLEDKRTVLKLTFSERLA